MQRILFASASCVLALGLSSLSFAAVPCAHAYNKVLPYDLPLGADQAQVMIHSAVEFNYDCIEAQAKASATADASFMNLDLNLLTAQARAVTQMNTSDTPGSIGEASVVVLGQEVVKEGLDLESLVDFDPSQDLDISDVLYFSVGPIPVPVQYGVEGVAGVHVKGGIQSIGLGLNVNPHVDSHAYVQAGVDTSIAQLYVRGSMVVLTDELTNLLHYGVYDTEAASELRFSVNSKNTLNALEGSVDVNASAMSYNYAENLFSWTGFSRNDEIYNFMNPVTLLR